MTPDQNYQLSRLVQHIKFPVRYMPEGTTIWDAENKMIIDVRGWGWIQYLSEGDQMQDALGEKIVEFLNNLNP
jgi:hypothetical protein